MLISCNDQGLLKNDIEGIILQYYTVIYDANDGSGNMENSSFLIGFWEKLEKNTFTKHGYVFNGWSTVPNGHLEFADEGFVKNLVTTPNKSITLYAVWGAPNPKFPLKNLTYTRAGDTKGDKYVALFFG